MSKQVRRPQRSCAVCRNRVDQDQLIRYVVAPGGRLVVDYQHKLPGRGAYTCFDRDCITRAVQRRAFTRSLKNAQIDVDIDSLITELRLQVEARVLNLIGMARKAGLVASGSQLVLASLKNPEQIAWVLLADDVTQNVGSKVREQTARACIPLIECFDKATLGQALGLSERSVLALKVSPLAQTLNHELQRYRDVMGDF
nr:DUF448 domain-containing protein [uncultured Desulfuromonas sp.]